MVATRNLIELSACHVKHLDFFQTTHCHENTEEEEDGGHINAAKHFAHAAIHAVGCVTLFAIEHFDNGPNHTKHQKNASEWWKTSKAVEYRNEAQATYAKEENHLALQACEHMILHVRGGDRGIEVTLEHPLHDERRYHH